jgi:hypothetical protein
MNVYHRIASSALAAAMVLGAVALASAQSTGAGTLTAARHFRAHRVDPTHAVLQAELQSNDGCHKVRFLAAPPTVVPPTILAQQYRYVDGMCTMAVTWQAASIVFSAPAGSHHVRVHATNGTFAVPY